DEHVHLVRQLGRSTSADARGGLHARVSRNVPVVVELHRVVLLTSSWGGRIRCPRRRRLRFRLSNTPFVNRARRVYALRTPRTISWLQSIRPDLDDEIRCSKKEHEAARTARHIRNPTVTVVSKGRSPCHPSPSTSPTPSPTTSTTSSAPRA